MAERHLGAPADAMGIKPRYGQLREVLAIRYLDDGGLSIVTGGKRRPIDYLLASRLLLYQLKRSARVNERAREGTAVQRY